MQVSSPHPPPCSLVSFTGRRRMHCASKFDCPSRTRWHRLKRSLPWGSQANFPPKSSNASLPESHSLSTTAFEDSLGHTLAGNLANLGMFEGWREAPVDDDENEDNDATDEHSNPVLFALGRRLPSGEYLTIATDASRIEEAQEAITNSFAWATAATLLLALAGGVVLSQGFLRRVDEINRATRAIMGGDLAERIRTTGSGDELDQLGRNLNDMLDRLQDLMDGLKQVSNDIAHDLRTPLSRLKQRLEAVRSEANSVQEYKEAVDQAVQDADMALSTFGALLENRADRVGHASSKFLRSRSILSSDKPSDHILRRCRGYG